MGFKEDFDTGSTSGKDDYFKVKEGANVVRILDEPAIIVSRFENGKFMGVCFEGAPYCTGLAEGERLHKKWKTWVIDRADGKVKLYDMPFTVAKEIRALLDNKDYTFDGFPMPFDLTISVKNAGKFEAEYSVLPARKDSALTEDEIKAFKSKTPVLDIINKAKANAKKEWEDKNTVQLDEPVEVAKDEPNPDDIPF